MAKASGKASYERNRGIQTTGGSTGPDRARQAQSDQIWNTAQAAGGAVPQPILQSQGTFGAQQTAGQQGLDAMSGNAAAAQQFMNPYQQQVMDNMTKQFGVQNQMTTQGINDQATQAGAFGGSRHGVAQGVALGENARNQGMLTANMLNQGFEGAMGRAGQVANLGFGAAQAGANLGMQAGSPELWRLNMLQRGVANQPYRTTNNQRTDDRSSRFSGSMGYRVGL
jgi:hypothetical protein